MHKAIWATTPELLLAEVEIPVTKPKGTANASWELLESHLPMFALFQSDRSSQDSMVR